MRHEADHSHPSAMVWNEWRYRSTSPTRLHNVQRDSIKIRITIMWKYAEIKCQLDATEVFIADLIACSTCFGHHYAHHQELRSIIQWLLPTVFHAVVFKLLVWCVAEGYVSGLQVWCVAEGYVSGLQDAAASCKPDT